MQKIVINNKIRLLPPVQIMDEIKEKFTILNPDFLKVMKFKGLAKKDWPKGGTYLEHLKVGNKWITKIQPQFIYYYDFMPGMGMKLPRSSLFEVQKLYKKYKIKYKIINEHNPIKPFKCSFKGELLPEKGQEAIKTLKHKNGIVQAPTGSGKTVMALWLVGKLQVTTCIVVDTEELANQWKARIFSFLGIKRVGNIGGGIVDIQPITIALMQTLRDLPEELSNFSLIIVDECHIAATNSYEKIINNYNGEYLYGLSATPKRRDGKTEVMHWLLGPTRVTIKYENAERCPAAVQIVPTEFTTHINVRRQYSKAMKELINDEERNKLIAEKIMQHIDHFGIHLVLSRFTNHLYNIQDKLAPHIQLLSRVLIGQINKKDRKEIVNEAAQGKLKFLFATEALLGKGFDEPLLSILHMTTPIKDIGFLTQCIGRVTRTHEIKNQALLFDYWDKNENVIGYTVRKRIEAYSELNIPRIK